MSEVEFLKDKIKSLQREKDQLQLQISKMRSSQSYAPPSQYSSQLQAENEKLKLDLTKLMAELAAKTALVATLQDSLQEAEQKKLSASLDAGDLFDDQIGRSVRLHLLQDAPSEFRDFLMFNDPKILTHLKNFLPSPFLPSFVSLLPLIYPSYHEVFRILLADLRVGTDSGHLRVLRVLLDVVTEAEELWTLLVRVNDVMKRAGAPMKELFLLATGIAKRLDAGQLKKMQKELSELILRASHAEENYTLDFLAAVAARTPDVLAFGSLRCNANCLNVAQRLLLQAVTGAFALRPMPPCRMRKILKIISKIAAVRAERGGLLELHRSLSMSEGNKIAPFRPPPIFGHLIDFLSSLVDALNLRPIFASDQTIKSDTKILYAFFKDFSGSS